MKVLRVVVLVTPEVYLTGRHRASGVSPIQVASRQAVDGYHPGMRPLTDIRRDRLRELADECGGGSALARKIEKDRRQVSAWLADPGKPGAKNPSNSTARWIERKCLKPSGWLDHESGANDQSAIAEPGAVSQLVGLDADILITAAGWVDFEEGMGDKIDGRDGLLRRVAQIYPQLVADGGDFTRAHAYEFMKAAEMRNAAATTRGKDIGKSEKRGRKVS